MMDALIDGMRAFNAKREERIRLMFDIPIDEGFRFAGVRMYTYANCECHGQGVLFDTPSLATSGPMTMTIRECPCVRYERVDVRGG